MFIPYERQQQLNRLIAKKKYILAAGGSRSGKTADLCYAVALRAYSRPSRHAILRYHFIDVKTSVGMDTLPKVLKLMGIPYTVNKTNWFFTIQCEKGGTSEIWIAGLDDKDRVDNILGKEFSTIYINEASQVSYHSYTTALTRLAENSGLNNKVFIDCNPPEKTHWLYQMFILGKKPESEMMLENPDLYGYIQMNPMDNPHLPEDYIRDVLESLPDRKKRRFMYGEWLDKRVGALWTTEVIDRYRVTYPPDFMPHTVIGIDPSVSSEETSDETGMIVVGMDGNGHFYVLKDLTGQYTPVEWARVAVNEYRSSRLDTIVAETNQGGDMVESNIRCMDSNVNYKGVRATRGKVLRAEPIEALYEQGRVHHVGYFPELEEQMCDWSPIDKYSPDRIDALVWAITYLVDTYPTSSDMGYAPGLNNVYESTPSYVRYRPPQFGSGSGGSVRRAPPSYRR